VCVGGWVGGCAGVFVVVYADVCEGVCVCQCSCVCGGCVCKRVSGCVWGGRMCLWEGVSEGVYQCVDVGVRVCGWVC
jgi:hypothetical protein